MVLQETLGQSESVKSVSNEANWLGFHGFPQTRFGQRRGGFAPARPRCCPAVVALSFQHTRSLRQRGERRSVGASKPQADRARHGQAAIFGSDLLAAGYAGWLRGGRRF